MFQIFFVQDAVFRCRMRHLDPRELWDHVCHWAKKRVLLLYAMQDAANYVLG